nr:hypothetical protein [uncultured Draconibacterium sp.]
MYFTEKNIKYADLVVPFTKCPFENVEADCPFVDYWKLPSMEEQITEMGNLSLEELEKLRRHHRRCLLKKVDKIQQSYHEKANHE